MTTAYNTLRGAGEATLIEKRSRFIAHAWPVATERAAQAYLTQLRKQYWDASHHVYAYIIGENHCRASDDGEPQGSSGPPVLETLKSAGIRDAVVVVVRYFGGTLLGVGGLARAYAQASRLALAEAGIAEKRLCRTYHAQFAYAVWDRVKHATEAYLTAVEYTDTVNAVFLVELSAADAFEALVADASGGTRAVAAGEGYHFL